MQINLNFRKKGFALGFLLKVRVFGTRKWPVTKTFKSSVWNFWARNADCAI